MTDEDINRKFDVVANHLAALAVGLDQLKERVDSVAGTVDKLSEKVDKVSEKVDRTADSVIALLAIAEIHEREIITLNEAVRATNDKFTESSRATDDKLNALISTVERFITRGGRS
jgi:peptidoglycan hydrolase CwlO-like protein